MLPSYDVDSALSSAFATYSSGLESYGHEHVPRLLGSTFLYINICVGVCACVCYFWAFKYIENHPR